MQSTSRTKHTIRPAFVPLFQAFAGAGNPIDHSGDPLVVCPHFGFGECHSGSVAKVRPVALGVGKIRSVLN